MRRLHRLNNNRFAPPVPPAGYVPALLADETNKTATFCGKLLHSEAWQILKQSLNNRKMFIKCVRERARAPAPVRFHSGSGAVTHGPGSVVHL